MLVEYCALVPCSNGYHVASMRPYQVKQHVLEGCDGDIYLLGSQDVPENVVDIRPLMHTHLDEVYAEVYENGRVEFFGFRYIAGDRLAMDEEFATSLVLSLTEMQCRTLYETIRDLYWGSLGDSKVHVEIKAYIKDAPDLPYAWSYSAYAWVMYDMSHQRKGINHKPYLRHLYRDMAAVPKYPANPLRG